MEYFLTSLLLFSWKKSEYSTVLNVKCTHSDVWWYRIFAFLCHFYDFLQKMSTGNFFPFSIWKCQTHVFTLIFVYLFRVYQNDKLTDKICIFRCSKMSKICFRFLSHFFHFIREKKIRAYWTNSITDSTTVKFA